MRHLCRWMLYEIDAIILPKGGGKNQMDISPKKGVKKRKMNLQNVQKPKFYSYLSTNWAKSGS